MFEVGSLFIVLFGLTKILIHLIVISIIQASHCDLLPKYREGVKSKGYKDVKHEEQGDYYHNIQQTLWSIDKIHHSLQQ